MTQHLSALDVLETHALELCVVYFVDDVKCQGECCLLLRDTSTIFFQTLLQDKDLNKP